MVLQGWEPDRAFGGLLLGAGYAYKSLGLGARPMISAAMVKPGKTSGGFPYLKLKAADSRRLLRALEEPTTGGCLSKKIRVPGEPLDFLTGSGPGSPEGLTFS